MEEKKMDAAPEGGSPEEEAKAQEPEATPAPEPEAAPADAPEAGADRERLLRLMAEFDNYKKRSARERENIYTDVRVDTVTRFLPVYDNLERALNAETADEAYKKGVEMTYQQLLEVFKKLGVEAIPAVGEKFDPTLHNAVMHVEDECAGENEIVQELQKGFKLGEKVIRFSMVKVAN